MCRRTNHKAIGADRIKKVQKRADINPTQALTWAAAISSGSCVWAVTHRRLVQSGAQVNVIIPSSLLLVLMQINMTEYLMPHVIPQSVFHSRKNINKTAWK